MPAKLKEDLQKVTLLLRAGDSVRLRDIYPDLPWSTVVRTLVSKHIDQITSGQAPAPKEPVKI